MYKQIIKSFLFCFIILLSPLSYAQCPQLIWSDEFDDQTLDETKWSYMIGDGCDFGICQWGNNELQWYAKENVTLGGGTLKITAKKESVQGSTYTSGRIRTINKGDIKYGRIESRMKMPYGQGIWPAFWMLPTDNIYGGWPESGEIDIMEYLGHETSTIHGTLHYGDPWPNNSSTSGDFKLGNGAFSDDFHDYALEWEENEIRWYIDGYLYSKKTRSDFGSTNWPFDQDFHFLYNMAVGGNWPGNPNSSTTFPQVFEIDYVRVYDLVDQAHMTGAQAVDNKAENIFYRIINPPADATVEWTLPDGASINSGSGNVIGVNFGDIGGNVIATVSSPCGTTTHSLFVKVTPPLATAIVLENFDDEALIDRTFQDGTFADNFSNPDISGVNTSALCGRYFRNGGSQYDVIVYAVDVVKDGQSFIDGDKVFYIDLHTNAPIGTTILLQLENASRSSGNYPIGRHSRFEVTTTKQNEWERLSFTFLDRPDNATSDASVNQMVILFAPNTSTNSTYYFDNFEIYAEATTSLVETQDDANVIISPNPATNEIQCYSKSNILLDQINIIDNMGRSLIKLKDLNTLYKRIDISNLHNGIYHLNIRLKDGNTMTQSLIKQ